MAGSADLTTARSDLGFYCLWCLWRCMPRGKSAYRCKGRWNRFVDGVESTPVASPNRPECHVRRFPIPSPSSVPQARSARDPAQQTRSDPTEPASTRRSWVRPRHLPRGSRQSSDFAFQMFNLVGSKNTMQRLVSRLKTRRGFTLVELAVVIVIIGVLAAFGVPEVPRVRGEVQGDGGLQLLGSRAIG